MPFTFEVRKAAQVVARILSHEPECRMNYLKLLKLLYILDRESLRRIGTPITGARPTAMKHGPVLSEIYDRVKECGELDSSEEWLAYFRTEGYDLVTTSDPGCDELSPFEIGAIDRVYADHGHKDKWELVELTHTFGEWRRNDPGETSSPIPLDHILEALDLSPESIDDIRAAAEEDALLSRMFGAR